MPKTVIKEIICPQCNAVTEGKLYTSINATNNPHLRNEVLEEKSLIGHVMLVHTRQDLHIHCYITI